MTSMRRVLHRGDASGRKACLKLNAKKKMLYIAGAGSSAEHEIRLDETPLENVKDLK